MNDLNLTIIDNLENHIDIDQVMMQCNKVDLVDFFPPHFIPDIASPDDMIEFEKIVETKCGIFDYNGGMVIILDNMKVFNYFQNIYNKLYGTDKSKMKYGGTDRELFTMNYYDISDKLHYTKCKLEFLKEDKTRKIARFSFVNIE